MGKYFGTDGFRGEANVDLTVEHAYKVGRYLGYYFGKDKKEVLHLTEVKWYLGIIAFAVVTITINIHGMFENLFLAFHHAAFQVG